MSYQTPAQLVNGNKCFPYFFRFCIQAWMMEASSSGPLAIPNEFAFPFAPYDIQEQFMRYVTKMQITVIKRLFPGLYLVVLNLANWEFLSRLLALGSPYL